MSDSRLSLKHHQLSTSKQIHQAKKKKKCSSRSQAWLAYLYVCSSAAVQLQVIKAAVWWDELYADKRIRRDDDQDKKTGVLLKSDFLEEILQESPSRVIEYWYMNSNISRYVYIMPSYNISDSFDAVNL